MIGNMILTAISLVLCSYAIFRVVPAAARRTALYIAHHARHEVYGIADLCGPTARESRIYRNFEAMTTSIIRQVRSGTAAEAVGMLALLLHEDDSPSDPERASLEDALDAITFEPDLRERVTKRMVNAYMWSVTALSWRVLWAHPVMFPLAVAMGLYVVWGVVMQRTPEPSRSLRGADQVSHYDLGALAGPEPGDARAPGLPGALPRALPEGPHPMTYSAKILADSIARDVRLTTFEVTFPRFILAEFNTHRVFSRNSASSRAIPVEKRIEQVRKSPFVPEAFTKNKRGMQADEGVDEQGQADARDAWLRASERACAEAWFLAGLGVHKQHANRLLEPFCWHTVVVTATEWDNFFALRTDKAAQPEMQITAKLMLEVYEQSTPRELYEGMWHLPYVTDEEWAALAALAHDPKDPERKAWESLRNSYVMCSVVRCAAVSYERQDAERSMEDILVRHDNHAAAGHWSPFEHQAKVASHEELKERATWSPVEHPEAGLQWMPGFIGNFRAPWLQYRKMFDGEAVWKGQT